MAEKKNGAKNLLIGIIVFVAGFFLLKSCLQPQPDKLAGEWQFAAMQKDVMIFSSDSTFQIKVDGGLYNQGDYRVDTSVSPARISIIPKKVYWFGGYPALPLTKGIMRFTDKNVLEIAFKIDPSSRQIGSDFPETFDYPNVKMILQRIK